MNQLDRVAEYDLAVVGGGSAGYAAAAAAAKAELKTVVIEGGKEVGGLCILRGCMPTKTLLYAADVLHLARNAATWGIDVPAAAFDFPKVMARKEAVIRGFTDYRITQLQSGRFDFIRAHAKFQDARTLKLSDGRAVSAAHFVLATGSVVAPPPLPQLQETGYLTSDDALFLSELPKSIIVLGGGAVAVEFAQFFSRFGVKVTLIQRSDQVLRDFDHDAAEVVERVFAREGIEIHHHTRLLDARRKGSVKSITFEKNGRSMEVEAEEIFFGLGRIPNTSGLELEKAGVSRDGHRIISNTQMQTTAPHIYAAGDCTGPHEIVHVAIQQGEIAVHNIIHPAKKRRMDYRLLINVIFSDPQLASVGVSEKTARIQKIPFLAASYPFNDHGKSIIMEALDGFVKLLADPRTGEILGGCAAGPMGGELIHEITVAMAKNMTVHELAALPHYHPTLAEIWTYPAEELAGLIPQPQPASPAPAKPI